ncbi:uncharacterized protein [Phyllobates terribilis]|uniref:uncharacterized protein n=1 Tax=Phyllobates terribilis TaxID=111132 RepID=UPI003CCB6F64
MLNYTVTYKISKRKPDDNLQLLHTILYGKKAKSFLRIITVLKFDTCKKLLRINEKMTHVHINKRLIHVHNLKKDIGLFSGFVWVENEEKQRAKVKEKIDKCVKEKLLDFCDVLNIPVNKSSSKKEDLSAKLLEFLQSPHATTDVLLADKEQKGKKRKSKATPSRSSSSKEGTAEKSSKKKKTGENQNKTLKAEEESGDEDKDENSDAKDESMEEDGDKKEHKEDEINSEEGDESKEKTPTPKSKQKSGLRSRKNQTDIKKHTSEKPSETKQKSRTTPQKSDSSAKDSTETKKTKSTDEKDSGRKQSGKSKSKKEKEKGKASKKENTGPSKEEMHSVVVNILQEVDFNTATLSDILRQLGTHFGLDLMHRKAEVKEIITDVMNSMSDDEDEEDE